MSHKIFRNVVWFEPGVPATEEQIAAVEQAAGTSIPRAYRAWLESVNGGTLEYGTDIPGRGTAHFVAWHRAAEPAANVHDRYGTLLFEWAITRQLSPERFLQRMTVSADEALQLWEEAHGIGNAELIHDVRTWIAHALPNWQPRATERSLEH